MANYDVSDYLQKLASIKKILSLLEIKLINSAETNPVEIEQANKIIKLFQDINLLETGMPVCPVDENHSGIISIEQDSEQDYEQPSGQNVDIILDKPDNQELEANTEMTSDPLASHTAQLLNNSHISYESYISTRKYIIVS